MIIPCKLLTGLLWLTEISKGNLSPGRQPPWRSCIVAVTTSWDSRPLLVKPSELLLLLEGSLRRPVWRLEAVLLRTLAELGSLRAGLRGGFSGVGAVEIDEQGPHLRASALDEFGLFSPVEAACDVLVPILLSDFPESISTDTIRGLGCRSGAMSTVSTNWI